MPDVSDISKRNSQRLFANNCEVWRLRRAKAPTAFVGAFGNFIEQSTFSTASFF